MHGGLQGNDQARVDKGQDEGQCAIDQRSFDNDINIPEPVTQNGDPECEWDRKHQAHDEADLKCESKWTSSREWEQDKRIEQTRPDIAHNGYRHTDHRPFGLLALSWRGHVAIAIQLEQHRTHDEAKKEHQTEHGSIEFPGGVEDNNNPIAKHDHGKPARPTRHKLSIRKN